LILGAFNYGLFIEAVLFNGTASFYSCHCEERSDEAISITHYVIPYLIWNPEGVGCEIKMKGLLE
jgi:hypothetical protein